MWRNIRTRNVSCKLVFPSILPPDIESLILCFSVHLSDFTIIIINMQNSEWDAYRAEIERIYIAEKKPLNQLREIMARNYGFRKT